MWIGNLSILETEQDILEKEQCRIVPKLDWLDKNTSGKDNKKSSGKRRREKT